MPEGSGDGYRPVQKEVKEQEPEEERLFQVARAWHEQFTKEKWQNQPSFHDAQHIDGVKAAALALVDEAIALENPYTVSENTLKDPLNIRKDVQSLLAQHPEIAIDLARALPILRKATVLFAGFHDTGNIMTDVVTTGDDLSPQFREAYQAKGRVEDTAINIAEKMIATAQFPTEEKALIQLFVRQLIDKTRFIPTITDAVREEPLFGLSAVSDQIGNAAKNVRGAEEGAKLLLNEMYREDATAKVRPGSFFNFAPRRVKELLGNNTAVIHRLEEIWGKKFADENAITLPEEEMSIEAFYQQFPQYKVT